MPNFGDFVWAASTRAQTIHLLDIKHMFVQDNRVVFPVKESVKPGAKLER